MKHYQFYINGEWCDSSERIEVRNPANDEVFATVAESSTKDAQWALESSDKAQLLWAMLPANDRGVYLHKIADKLKTERDHFAKLLVLEQGKTLAEAFGEVDDTIQYIIYSAEAARRIQGAVFPSEQAGEYLAINKVPYGVTLGLCAYNYPLALIGRKIGPALVTGNTMIIKPHELTPITASEFCRICDEIGLPKGVINMVAGKGLDVASHLVASPITKLVSVTGSIRAGQGIYKAASENITALSLELGGKAPFIVLDDADIDKAVEAAVISRYANCGQVCICNEVVMVHEKIADEFTDKVLKRIKEIKVGDPMQKVDMGPSVSSQGLANIQGLINDSVAKGAEIVAGGARPEGAAFEKGYWYQPTVLTNVKEDHAVVEHEIFGPVMPIMKIGSYEEALERQNKRNDGLSAYLYTSDYKKFMHAIDHLQVGTIFINRGIVGYIQGYHSGHKRSGLGGEDGIHGIEGYLQKKTIYLDYK
ncbi:aldehyde dehydrogenase family protein [Arcticibacterium luteifluviistationis]|uniref:Aldehyde dehydrogenase n=1 Tax=Arcticibacterium luteifluviistationis TaxID=1784714 RepID=A0A2Z4G6J0_9BACT|nr:aldehyde dehydrogenase family protein [Arcticibacterium luteifluviistationis]AWV96762.1 aldehyde dehydrogenase [Arcticibacterium luteifluviistationis]